MRLFRYTVLVTVMTLMMIGLGGASQVMAKCYSWDTARAVIKENGLVAAGAVRRNHSRGRMIEFKLCKIGGRFVYRVVTMQPGRVNKMIVDAASGATLGRSDGRSSLPAGVGGSVRKSLKLFKRKRSGY
ncbi:MAG: PepSY domain-containing protein [Methyloligellaceae bacterium]